MDLEEESGLPDTETYTPPSGDASIGHLVKEITEDLSTLVRKEVELAKGEISEIVRTKAKAAALLLVAAVIAVLVLPFALISMIEVLAIWLPRWGASLVVTGIMIILGLIAFAVARKQLQSKMLPQETIATIKEDVRWAKNLKK